MCQTAPLETGLFGEEAFSKSVVVSFAFHGLKIQFIYRTIVSEFQSLSFRGVYCKTKQKKNTKKF